MKTAPKHNASGRSFYRSLDIRFVMTIGILRGRHCFAFADVNRVDDFAFRIDYLVRTRLRTNIPAI